MSTTGILDKSVLPQSAWPAEAEQGGGDPLSSSPSESLDVAQQQEQPTKEVANGTRPIAQTRGGIPASPASGRFDASLDALQLKQRIDFELRLNRVPNFSASSTKDDADERW